MPRPVAPQSQSECLGGPSCTCQPQTSAVGEAPPPVIDRPWIGFVAQTLGLVVVSSNMNGKQ